MLERDRHPPRRLLQLPGRHPHADHGCRQPRQRLELFAQERRFQRFSDVLALRCDAHQRMLVEAPRRRETLLLKQLDQP
jgi:hypothetical protein